MRTIICMCYFIHLNLQSCDEKLYPIHFAPVFNDKYACPQNCKPCDSIEFLSALN